MATNSVLTGVKVALISMATSVPIQVALEDGHFHCHCRFRWFLVVKSAVVEILREPCVIVCVVAGVGWYSSGAGVQLASPISRRLLSDGFHARTLTNGGGPPKMVD